MAYDPITKLEEAKAHYRAVKVNAAKTISRLGSLQRSQKKRSGGWPWGKQVQNLEAAARACSDAEDQGWAKIAEWANQSS